MLPAPAESIQGVLISLELAALAVAHLWVFGWKDFVLPEPAVQPEPVPAPLPAPAADAPLPAVSPAVEVL